MTTSVNEALSAIYESFMAESRELESRMRNNKERIQELDGYVESIQTDIESAGKIFSPHQSGKEKIDSIKIEELYNEKGRLENENLVLLNELNVLDSRINNIKNVISMDPYLNRFVFFDMQEKERQRIARDLHDSSIQNLTHLLHSIELSTLFIDNDPQRAKLELRSIAQKVRSVIEEIRNTIYDLRPMEFDDLGFREAVKSMIDKLQKETSIFLKLEMEKEILAKNNLVFSNIYRIIRECVINAIKHSKANEIVISIYEKNEIFHAQVTDDGIGFHGITVDDNHFGLQLLEERVQLLKGTLKIGSSEKNKTGTSVTIEIPLKNLDDK
jgi:two-component system sensor histidine kinase DegS